MIEIPNSKTREKDWVKSIIPDIKHRLSESYPSIRIEDSEGLPNREGLPYVHEITRYSGSKYFCGSLKFKPDILVYEMLNNTEWRPRLIIEAKLRITTHTIITYSQKAALHKHVHPYLRYGILIGKRNHLPGRLFRHGAHFDFMISFKAYKPSENELKIFIDLIKEEIKSSKRLEEIIYKNRIKDREKFTFLQRPLIVK